MDMNVHHQAVLRQIARTSRWSAKRPKVLVKNRSQFQEERDHAKAMVAFVREPAPTSSVMRLTGEYVPYMKHNRQVDFEKVQHKL